jgi:hypothetical protein
MHHAWHMPYGYTPAAVSRLAFALATMPGPATPKTSRGAWSYEAARAARYVTDHTFRHVSDTYFFTNQIISYPISVTSTVQSSVYHLHAH